MYWYFSRKANSYCEAIAPDPLATSKVDFSDYLKILNFTDHIYHDKRVDFNKIKKENPTFISDVAASVIGTLAISNCLSDSLLQKGLDCCSSILHDMGYDEAHIDTLMIDVAHDNERIIIIPGCQDVDMVRRRVECAVTVFKGLHRNAKFVASGSNPNRQSVKIKDEAKFIKTELVRKLDSQIEIISIKTEGESIKTSENIDNLFSGLLSSIAAPTSVFIVSSTFHLMRLANQIGKIAPAHHEILQKLNYITLAGC